jgi:sortase A
VGGLGRTLVIVGALLVLFSGFKLWGTGLTEQRAQDSLAGEFAARQAALAAPTTTPPTTAPAPDGTPATTAPPVVAPELAADLFPGLGETVGRIRIPVIDVDKYVVHGVRRDDLRQGPGHYPDSPLPGQAGNAAIAGHRTTYGAPFGDLDLLRPGDRIEVETLQGTFHYEVMGHPGPDGGTVGHLIVDPFDGVVVLDDFGDDRLTLTACHPKYSAAQRIVVTALLVTPPAPDLPRPVTPAEPTPVPDDGSEVPELDDPVAAGDDALDEALGWNLDELRPAAGWGLVTAALAGLVTVAGRRWRRLPAWLLGTPVVGAALFVTFGHLDRLLPAL